MTDETILPTDPPQAEPHVATSTYEPQPLAAPEPIERDRARLALPLSVLSLLLVLALAGYVGWTALHPPQPAVDPARVDALEQQANAMSTQLRQVQQRPIPAPPDLKPIEQRLAALEQRANSPAEDASRSDLVALAGRVDQVAGRQDALGTREQTDVAAISTQLDTLDTKLGADAKLAGQIGSLADRQARATRIQAASSALNAGQPLGDVPGAPPALQRFARAAPPTEASLRLSFDEAAQAAQLASQPAVDSKPFLDRVWARAQQSVTVRQGDRVLLGDPIAGVLEHAKQALDAGDLAGAVAALDQLAGPAAAAMAEWKANAQALLDARGALLTLARG